MTLHWWMHWFWVTAQIVATLTIPTSELSSQLSIDQESPIVPASPPPSNITMIQQRQLDSTLARLQQNYRIAKAIGIQPSAKQMAVAAAAAESSAMQETIAGHNSEDLAMNSSVRLSTPSPFTAAPSNNSSAPFVDFTVDNATTTASQPANNSKIAWIKTPRTKELHDEALVATSPIAPIVSNGSESAEEQLTVMPLDHRDPNAIVREEPNLAGKASDDLLLGVETVEPRIVATAASVLDAAGLSDSTRLGRARGTFTSEFHGDQQQHRAENKVMGASIKEVHDRHPSGDSNVTEIATITGSCLAVVVLLSTVGSLGFIMYRRRYLNPPQTLNSDKCSNPDSSGYIDDSTIRDNSEEMYSLDNDSFLNSLEAMTIQNYWTDSVKHTKL